VHQNILHDFYAPDRNFCPVFPQVRLSCQDGFRVPRRGRGVFAVDAGIDRRLRGSGEKEMSWAYVLSGLLSLGLLIYLVAALIRAEDL
jgi:K+-transporting ATPase KdpF subunit